MNALAVATIIILVLFGINGYKKGLIDGIVHLLSYILGIAVLFVIVKGVGNFMEGSFLNVLIALILLLVIRIIDKILKLLMDSVKLVSRLPVIHSVDKLAGVVLGAARGLCLIWILFILFEVGQITFITEWIQQQVAENDFMKIVYHSNLIVRLLLFL